MKLDLPSGKRLHNYGKSTRFYWPAKSTISMVIFNSYVSLSEGTYNHVIMIYEYNIWLVVWNMFLFFHLLGFSSSQLTFTPSFFRGVGVFTTLPPTRYDICEYYAS